MSLPPDRSYALEMPPGDEPLGPRIHRTAAIPASVADAGWAPGGAPEARQAGQGDHETLRTTYERMIEKGSDRFQMEL